MKKALQQLGSRVDALQFRREAFIVLYEEDGTPLSPLPTGKDRVESRQIIHIHKTDGISLDMAVETGGRLNG